MGAIIFFNDGAVLRLWRVVWRVAVLWLCACCQACNNAWRRFFSRIRFGG